MFSFLESKTRCFYLIVASLHLAKGKIALLVRSEVVIHTAPLKHWNPYQLRRKSELTDKPNFWTPQWLRCSYPSTYTINLIIQLFSSITLIWVAVRQQFHLKGHQNLLSSYSQLCAQWAVPNHIQVVLNHSKKTMVQVLYPYPFPGATAPTYFL